MTESHVIRLVDGLKEMGMFRGKDRRVNGDVILVFVRMKDCDGELFQIGPNVKLLSTTASLKNE